MSAHLAKLRALALLAGLTAALSLLSAPSPATACGCGPHTPLPIARGVSLYGVPWRIRAGEERFGDTHQVTFGFTLGRKSEPNDAGYFTGMSLPISRRFVVTGTAGSGTDPELEGDISGIASRRAIRLVATMEEGPPLEIETQIAPKVFRDRYPWLRGLEFFDQWYPSERTVKRLVAYNRAGQIIGTSP